MDYLDWIDLDRILIEFRSNLDRICPGVGEWVWATLIGRQCNGIWSGVGLWAPTSPAIAYG